MEYGGEYNVGDAKVSRKIEGNSLYTFAGDLLYQLDDTLSAYEYKPNKKTTQYPLDL